MVFSYQLLEVCTARNLQAIAPVPLVAGDSMYIGIPWTESIKKESLESRASLVARRLYHGQLLHAITFAKATAQKVLWVVAEDVPHDSGPVSHQADLVKQQTRWLQLHDRQTAGILGLFPLIAGMPTRFTETYDRDARVFKHATATLVGWGLSPADVLRIEASDEPEVALQDCPSFLAARLTSPPRHLTDGIVLIRPTTRSWTLRSLRVQRRGFHVAPDFFGTAHAYCGTTLAPCKGDLLHWSATPTPDSRLRAYIIRSRVKAADDILLVQPYSPQLFRQPKAPGPTLLLARQQGRVSHIYRTKKLV